MENFLELVKAERQKQINKYGYTPEHDDEHTDGSIADAAACYASTKNQLFIPIGKDIEEHKALIRLWPWEPKYFKKSEKSREDQLITSAAMLMAEYERIVRFRQKLNGATNEIPQH